MVKDDDDKLDFDSDKSSKKKSENSIDDILNFESPISKGYCSDS